MKERKIFSLRLADRSSWEISGGDLYGEQLAAHMAAAMILNPSAAPQRGHLKKVQGAETRALIIKGISLYSPWRRLPQSKDGRVICAVGPAGDAEMSMVHLLNVSQLLASFCEPGGGLLLHAALVRKGRRGFILMGGSGSGKTTASQRIPAPWRSCCDDYTLVVRDDEGGYWAHPWPTWSRFFRKGPGGSWPVMTPVQLAAIFFLQPAAVDAWGEPLRRQTVVKIMESVEQAMWSTTLALEKSRRHSIRLGRLKNASNLGRAVPAFHLHLTLNGKFWDVMENALVAGGIC